MDLQKAIFKVSKRGNPEQMIFKEILKNQENKNYLKESGENKETKKNINLNLSNHNISQNHRINNNNYNKQKMNKTGNTQYSPKGVEMSHIKKDYITYLISPQRENILKKDFDSYLKSYPLEWENYELILILATGNIYNDFENVKNYINIYLYEGMKKLMDQKIIDEILHSKIKDDNLIKLECEKFYKYKKEINKKIIPELKELKSNELYHFLIATSLIYQKTKEIEELDLTQYNLKSDTIQPILSSIKFNVHIQKLILTENNIGEEGCYWLGVMLRNNKQLYELDLSNCKISNKCISFIVKGLENKENENYSLKKINLTGNDINENKGGEELGNFLEKFNSLTWLNVCKNKLRNEGLKTFLLKYEKLINKENKKTKLETLILFGNYIKSQDSLTLLGQILKNENCTLKSLVLSDNEIGSSNDDNFKNFCENLSYNNSLTELLLLDCNIGNEDVNFICDMLVKNKKLEKLCLYHNNINSHEKFLQILSVFKGENGNKTLKELDLSKNNCKIPISEEFLDNIKNIQLESLDISQNFDLNEGDDLEKFQKATKEVQDKIKIIY